MIDETKYTKAELIAAIKLADELVAQGEGVSCLHWAWSVREEDFPGLERALKVLKEILND